MPKLRKTLTLFFLLFSSFTYGQVTYLDLDYDCSSNIQKQNYIIRAIDNRTENQKLGFVRTGMFNKSEEIKFKGDLADSLKLYFSNLGINKDIVIMLNEFNMWEFVDRGEFGRFKLSLRFFEKSEDNSYTEFFTVDSLYSVSGIDVTKKMLRNASIQLCQIANDIRASEKTTSSTMAYSVEELYKLDSLEKIKIPIFQSLTPKEGIYENYIDFSNNTPSIQGKILIDTSSRSKVKAYLVNQTKKKTKIQHRNIYAISDGKTFYKSVSMGFFQMIHEDNDFFYIRPSTVGNSYGFIPILGGGLVGGMVAGAAAGLIIGLNSGNNQQILLYKINHRRGNSIPLSKIERKK